MPFATNNNALARLGTIPIAILFEIQIILFKLPIWSILKANILILPLKVKGGRRSAVQQCCVKRKNLEAFKNISAIKISLAKKKSFLTFLDQSEENAFAGKWSKVVYKFRMIG